MDAPARFLARRMAATDTPSYLYRYSYVPAASRTTMTGAQHAAEVSLVFRNQTAAPYFTENAADTPMVESLSGYWVRFAKTGNPNGAGAPVWPSYDPAHDALLNFTNDGPIVQTHVDAEKFDTIDAAYLDRAHLTEPRTP